MELLKLLQEDLPLLERPYRWIGEKLGISEGEVISQIKELKEKKLIRQLSPIYDTKRAGYDSSLVAFKVNPENLESVAQLVSESPGVSHNYEREDEFNLWFTLAVPPDSPLSLEEIVKRLAEKGGVENYAILRTKKTFKIGVKLSFESIYEREEAPPVPKEPEPVPLSEKEKLVIRATQDDLPLVERPFKVVGESIDLAEGEVIETLKKLKEKGVLRRFSAILYHRRAGFKANGMSVWRVNNGVEKIGRLFASFKAVSHCYERTTNSVWRYNLFAMVHGRTREEVLEFCEFLSKESGIPDYRVLFSKKEFKKRRVRLFDEGFYRWVWELT